MITDQDRALLDAWWATEPFGFDHPDTYNGILKLMSEARPKVRESDDEEGVALTLEVFKIVNVVPAWEGQFHTLRLHLAQALSTQRAEAQGRIEELEGALLMVLGSTLLEHDGHDWITCDQPSCIFARKALRKESP